MPSRTLRQRGAQPDARFSLPLLIRCERESSSAVLPPSAVSQPGSGLGLDAPIARAQILAERIPGHRLIVGDGVDPARSSHRSQHRRRCVLVRDRGPVGSRRSREGRPAPADGGEQVAEHPVRSVEAGEAEDHRTSPAPSEALGRCLRVQHGPVVRRRAHRPDLVDPPVAAILEHGRERLLDQALDARGDGRLGQDRRTLAPDAVVLPPGPREQHAERRGRHVGGKVDDRGVSGDRGADRCRLEEVHGHRGRSDRPEQLALLRCTADGAHPVSRGEQERQHAPSDDAAGAGEQHAMSLVRCRIHGTQDDGGGR